MYHFAVFPTSVAALYTIHKSIRVRGLYVSYYVYYHSIPSSAMPTTANIKSTTNPDSCSRILCTLGLVLSLSVSLACIIFAVIISSNIELRYYDISLSMEKIIPLALNFAVTLSTECLGFIHATSLKWALSTEDTLDYNANLRLFTSAKRSYPNGRVCNALYLFALALCYAATPTIINTGDVGDGTAALRLNSAGLGTLGTALLVICFLALWALFNNRSIPTWSSNPIVTCAAVTGLDPNLRREGRCMRSVHDEKDSAPARPTLCQGSLYSVHRNVRAVLWAEYSVLVLLIVGTITVAMTARPPAYFLSQNYLVETTDSWSLIPEACNTPIGFVVTNCTTRSATLNFLSSDRISSSFEERYVLAEIFFMVLVQSVITAGVHCAGLIVTLSRDEAAWRAVTSEKGSNTSRTSALFALLSWQSLELTCFKPLLHWFFGLAVSIVYYGLTMFVPQLVYLTIAWVFFLAFITFVAFQKPKGPLPATYGHIQTLADLVDEWSENMHWGHKSEGEDGICHAGTSKDQLPEVRMDSLYKGTSL